MSIMVNEIKSVWSRAGSGIPSSGRAIFSSGEDLSFALDPGKAKTAYRFRNFRPEPDRLTSDDAMSSALLTKFVALAHRQLRADGTLDARFAGRLTDDDVRIRISAIDFTTTDPGASKVKSFDDAEVYQLLLDRIQDAGGQRSFAKQFGCCHQYIGDVVLRRRPISARLGAAVGVERVTIWRARTDA